MASSIVLQEEKRPSLDTKSGTIMKIDQQSLYNLEFNSLPLHKIAEIGDAEKLDAYISTTYALSVNILDRNGFSPIHYAAKNNNYHVITALLTKLPCDVDLVSKDGYTALHLAVKYKRVESVKTLISFGANAKVFDQTGKAAVHLAARKGNLQILQMLLRCQGADVNFASKEGMNTLHYAICGGHLVLTKWLIQKGVNVRKPDISGQTPLIVACMERNSEIISLLIEAANQDKLSLENYLHHSDVEGSAAIHMATLNCHMRNIATLLDTGANVNFTKMDGSSALHIAAKFGFTEIALYLMSKGAQVDCQDDLLITPLHFCPSSFTPEGKTSIRGAIDATTFVSFRAAQYDNQDCAEALLNAGADLNSRDRHGMSALHYASQKGHVNMIALLIERHADVMIKDKLGRTVLHWAVVSEKLGSVEEIQHRLSEIQMMQLIATRDHDEQTALHYAATRGQADILELLLNLGASAAVKDEQEKTPMHCAAEKGHATSLEILFKHSKLEINDDDSDGRTPMLLACLNGHYNCVKTLLNFGGDVTARGRDESNHSALTLAAFEGHAEIVDILLDNNAHIEAITKFKETAFHLACKGNHTKVVRLLLDRKASLCARNYNNLTPLDVAIECRSKEAAEAIIKSERWEEAMVCIDENGRNPLPRLIVFLPCVAEQVLDRCITYRGDPSFEDYAVTYNFKYIDIDPRNPMCHTSKVWYVNDMVEHEVECLLLHDLVTQNIQYKWKRFGRAWFWADTAYYILVLTILSTFVMYAPNLLNHNTDDNGCPMVLLPGEEANETLYQYYKKVGTKDRYKYAVSDDVTNNLGTLRWVTCAAIGLSALRLIIACVMLRQFVLRHFTIYTTVVTIICIEDFIVGIDTETMVACSSQWRHAWIGLLFAWLNFLLYLSRMEGIGLFVIMFARVCLSVAKVLLALVFIIMAFAFCFHITLNERAEFRHSIVSILSVLDMAIGEIKFVDRLVKTDIRPMVYDNYALFGAFMVMVPIALVNLLIGIAVGDIESIRSMANLKQVIMKVLTIFEYEAHNLRVLQVRWYTESITVYPNMATTTYLAKIMIKAFLRSDKNASMSLRLLKLAKCIEAFKTKISRSAFLPKKGWPYYSRQMAAGAESLETVFYGHSEEQKKQLKTMKDQLDYHNELLLAIASRVGAEIDPRGKAILPMYIPYANSEKTYDKRTATPQSKI